MARSIEREEVPGLLIAAANRKDRFSLLDDISITEPNIDVDIHPVFAASNFINASPQIYQGIQQSLRFASAFLQYDSILEWFVSPLLGLPLLDSTTGKSYLSDPLTGKFPGEKHELVRRVRKAFECLAHSVHFHFLKDTDVKFYARTTLHSLRPRHTPMCTQHFNRSTSVKIEIRKQYWDFYKDHYASSSLCERLRVDFSLGVGLVHELCHAIGVMRRGNLCEPHLRLDHLQKPEFGYAWENFVFGGIINPFDRNATRISFLMRKIWAEDSEVYAAGGKEWSAVPMSYIAQWFQKDTWSVIAERGPTAIPQPTFHLKLRAHEKEGYSVITDDEQAKADVKALKMTLVDINKHKQRVTKPLVALLTAKIEKISTEALQRTPVPAPTRMTTRYPPCQCASAAAKPQSRPLAIMVRSYSSPPDARTPLVDRRQTKSAQPLKRAADSDDDFGTTRSSKRVKQVPGSP